MEAIKDKVVVITGAGNGLGRSLAQLLAKNGAKLALNSKTKSNLDQTVKSLKLNEEYIYVKSFDISKKKDVFNFAKAVKKHFGHIDIVINNAGVAITGLTFEELEVEDFEWIFSINFMGMIYTTKAFLPYLMEQKNTTTLVNISSIFGKIPMALKTPYCSTKYAMRGFTDSLRMELRNTPVNVMGVYPGGLKTAITINSLKADKEPEYTKEFNKKLKMHPDKAANLILQGILKHKQNLIIGNDAKMGIFANMFMPFVLNNMAKKVMLKFKT